MKSLLRVLGGATVLGLLSTPVSAGFDGTTVSADYFWPDLDTIYLSSGTAIVSAGVEFPNIAGWGLRADFSDSNIRLTYPDDWSNCECGGSFDGWVFTKLSPVAPAITGVSLAETNFPGLTASNLSFDADHVYANTMGLGSWKANTFFSINVSFAAPVPEPETYAMMLAGLGLLGFAARRRKQ